MSWLVPAALPNTLPQAPLSGWAAPQVGLPFAAPMPLQLEVVEQCCILPLFPFVPMRQGEGGLGFLMHCPPLQPQPAACRAMLVMQSNTCMCRGMDGRGV